MKGIYFCLRKAILGLRICTKNDLIWWFEIKSNHVKNNDLIWFQIKSFWTIWFESKSLLKWFVHTLIISLSTQRWLGHYYAQFVHLRKLVSTSRLVRKELVNESSFAFNFGSLNWVFRCGKPWKSPALNNSSL